MKKGDLIRNKYDGKFAIVLSTFTKFFQDPNYTGQADYGVAGTAVRIKWTDDGQERTLKKSKMRHNWEVLNESR